MLLCIPKQANKNVLILLWTSLQIYDGLKKPEVLVDGWNVYFSDDLKTLVSVWGFLETGNTSVNLPLMHCPNNAFSLCSPVAGQSTGRTRRRWESCGLACCASIPRTLTSESTLCVSVSMDASPPLTSSGRLNTLSLKVSLCDNLTAQN